MIELVEFPLVGLGRNCPIIPSTSLVKVLNVISLCLLK